ncbi:agmatine deiminase family protein [Thiorhodovibrio frisius]|uniref:Peptidylarginine deiminase-like enzyme n=1 Tax=Thiorhodovibrio frisius TaxID=631362 RepID=H8Z046_9GAMM|nr:agmatine deiminase family protein [Thiorhodovibrio frisius]EIC21219.1 peptidylarginine deiminase-like enzyme [Thiorhodovibrio frisius]WPL23795.1 Agmatine deiminase [Thiorhodovibrio frisius]
MKTLPAEWYPQSALMLTWPHPDTDWCDQLDAVEAVYVEMVCALCRYQPALILCPDTAWQARVAGMLADAGVPSSQLIFALARSNDTWTRDHGPITVLETQGLGAPGQPCLLDFRFNGWGGKYASELDDAINARLQEQGVFGNSTWQRSELLLEGGAIDSDGAGSLLLVRRTLLDPARNPGWSQDDIEQELHQRLGIRHFLWLEHGQLSGDDTDGHIDTLARFIDQRTIAHVTCDDPADPDHDPIAQMTAELRALRDSSGQPYRLLPLPQPRPLFAADGQRLPAGYANFALINGALLLPVYQDPADAEATRLLQAAFPQRQVHAIDCRALVAQGGSLHCACMQLPAGLTIRAPQV